MSDKVLEDCGFVVSAKKAHATECRFGDIVVYSVPTDDLNIVISPEDYVFVKSLGCEKYHNSNLTAFPKEINTGENKIHYGYKIVFENSLEMKEFIKEYLKHKSVK